MHWSVDVWIIAILCFVVYHPNIIQNIPNCLASFVSGASRFTHIIPPIKSLHWLPVKQQIIFKTLVFIYKYNWKAQSVLPHICLCIQMLLKHDVADKMFLKVPYYSIIVPQSINQKFISTIVFPYDAPKLCNNFPLEI